MTRAEVQQSIDFSKFFINASNSLRLSNHFSHISFTYSIRYSDTNEERDDEKKALKRSLTEAHILFNYYFRSLRGMIILGYCEEKSMQHARTKILQCA